MKKRQHAWPSLVLSLIIAISFGGIAFGQDTEYEHASPLRWEAIPVGETAELLTLFFRQREEDLITETDLPLLSVVRDTLGRGDREVHRLRYVWVHTYTAPSLRQRVAAGIPFLYNRFGNASVLRNRVPLHLIDLSVPSAPLWKQIRETVLMVLPFYPKPPLFQTTVQTYSRNQSRYKNAQLTRAATVLDLDDPGNSGSPALTDKEGRELQARLSQTQKFLSQFLEPAKLERMYLNEMNAMRLRCAKNWELLRQRAEAEGLFFDPLALSDGTATHALLWVAKEDVEKNRKAEFDGRFLNIGSPWNDKVLKNWAGITETRYFDRENRPVDLETFSARRVDLIPLALYGLDHPKIPALLVDFRRPLNAKRRELSARARDAVAENLLPVSSVTKLAQNTAHVILRRKGADLFQPSRARSYSQLKTVLALDMDISPQMREEIARRVEFVADNPLENDFKTELQLARNQYQALLNYALREDGLKSRLQRDRRTELASTTHKGSAKVFLKLAEVTSLGVYKHREPDTPDLLTLLETSRRTLHHEEFLRAVMKSGFPIEIEWDVERIRESLHYVVSDGAIAPAEIASIALDIFGKTWDEKTKRACLDTIQALDAPVAQSAFLRLLRNQNLSDHSRAIAAQYLRIPNGTPPVNDVKAVQSAVGGGAN
jgi:hypothetical protein